jgi:hypothetical protein
MPAQTLSVSDEILDTAPRSVDPDKLITEKQAAKLLGCSPESMKSRRRSQSDELRAAAKAEGRPVPAERDLLPWSQKAKRHAIHYRLGDILDERKKHVHVSTDARDVAAAQRAAGNQIGMMGFADFLANATINDRWLFTSFNGLPIDFIHSLEIAEQQDWNEEEVIEELTLGQYLERRLKAAKVACEQKSIDKLDSVVARPIGVAAACPRCGKPAHGGACRL